MESIVDKTETQIGVAEEALKEKWIKELEIYCKLKSAFILEGDVFDKRRYGAFAVKRNVVPRPYCNGL